MVAGEGAWGARSQAVTPLGVVGHALGPLSTTACALPPRPGDAAPRGPALGGVHSGSLGNVNTDPWGGKPSKPAAPECPGMDEGGLVRLAKGPLWAAENGDCCLSLATCEVLVASKPPRLCSRACSRPLEPLEPPRSFPFPSRDSEASRGHVSRQGAFQGHFLEEEADGGNREQPPYHRATEPALAYGSQVR